MPRKTNKTNHILNLLAGNSEAEEEEVREAPKARRPKKAEKAAAESTVQVVEQKGVDEEIAETVNKMLDEELAAEQEKQEAEGSEAVVEAAAGSPAAAEEAGKAGDLEAVVETAAGSPAAAEEATEAGASDDGDTAASEPAQGFVETVPERAEASASAEKEKPRIVVAEPVKKKAKKEAEAEDTAEEAGMAAATEAAVIDTKAETGKSKSDYVFINVMEQLTRKRARDYMEEFGNCTCSRCTADTMAAALSNLPPKYVVVSRDKVAPLMDFYSQRYAGQVTVEITKACLRVREHPHHNRG